MIAPTTNLQQIAVGKPRSPIPIAGELSWIESRALDAGNPNGDTMAGVLTTPGVIMGGTSISLNNFSFFATDTGVANAISVTITGYPTTPNKGLLMVRGVTANTGATTISINGSAGYTITNDGAALTNQKWKTGDTLGLVFNGTTFTLLFVGGAGSQLDTGARMLFQMPSVPIGWTQDTTVQNDSLLRMVNGAGGGVYGANGVSSVLRANATSNGTAISVAQMPSHNHDVDIEHQHDAPVGGNGAQVNFLNAWGTGQGGLNGAEGLGGGNLGNNNTSFRTSPISVNSSGNTLGTTATGGNQAHTHTLTALNISSIDIIVGVKN